MYVNSYLINGKLIEASLLQPKTEYDNPMVYLVVQVGETKKIQLAFDQFTFKNALEKTLNKPIDEETTAWLKDHLLHKMVGLVLDPTQPKTSILLNYHLVRINL